MSSKYSGLPDIDTAPDVFETPDEPEPILYPDQDREIDDVKPIPSSSTAIDATGLPPRDKARRSFVTKNKSRKSPLDQYLFTSARPSRYSGDADNSEEETLSAPETSAARLRRLKAEVAELEKQMTETPIDPSTDTKEQPGKRQSILPPRRPVDLLDQVTSLRTRLNALDTGSGGRGVSGCQPLFKSVTEEEIVWPKALDDAKSEGKEGSNNTTVLGQRQQTGQGWVGISASSLTDIDRRLTMLETVIGPSERSVIDDTPSPVIPTLVKLDHLVSLLTQPRHLDAISRRVKLLLVELDRAAAASRRPGTTGTTSYFGTENKTPSLTVTSGGPNTTTTSSGTGGSGVVTLSHTDHQNLQTLFSLLNRLDPLLPVLPPLLARLKSLSSLHADASDIAAGLRGLQSENRMEEEEKKEMETLLASVKEGLEEAITGIQRNWNAVNERMKDLENRITALANSD